MQITPFIYPFSGILGCFQFLLIKKSKASMFPFAEISLGYILKVEWPRYRVHVPSLVFGIVQLFHKIVISMKTLDNS